MDNEWQNQKRANSSAGIKEMVKSGNMEQLAALVLNGEGEKLIGETSDNPELQTFLDNVPIYMVSGVSASSHRILVPKTELRRKNHALYPLCE